MSVLKAAYVNELYKLSKKKKITVASVLSVLAVIIAAIIVFNVKSIWGFRVAGSSEFPILVLSVLNYTLIPIFTAFVCIDMTSGEFADATIKMTLTTPASRLKVFTAKTLAVATYLYANLLFVLILSVIASLFINGAPVGVLSTFVAYTVSLLPLFVFALMVMVIGNITKGTTSTFMFSVIVYLVFLGLGIAFPNYKSFMFTSLLDWYLLFLGSYINISKIIRVFLILSGCGIMFFGIGYYLFEKKDI